MKTLSTLFTIAFFSLTANLFASAPQKPDSVMVADTNRVDVMVLKLDKGQKGGHVVITDSQGEEVSKMTIKRKRMIIDFDKVNFGDYKVKVVKEGVELAAFHYSKTLVISDVVR
ncbi:MAG TPA: hypothetical protein PKW06_06075 [Cyclobacteriaceae bacterium]|nr:hypothetical protein [Cyclobacteriaceae bacterium]HOO09486.1 hypothetical protein [Cyclobacteriaceae bacterium]HPI79275.1 hypothetical protein [Cyclobacteriaceae bacterium]